MIEVRWSHACFKKNVWTGSEFVPADHHLAFRITFRCCCYSIDLQQYDHPHSLLLLRQGKTITQLLYAVTLTHSSQVVADLWERYLALLDEGKEDGYVLDKRLGGQTRCL